MHPENSPSPYPSPSPNSYHSAMPFQTPLIPNPYVQHPGAYGIPFQMQHQSFQGFHHDGAFPPNPTPSENPSFAFGSNPKPKKSKRPQCTPNLPGNISFNQTNKTVSNHSYDEGQNDRDL